MKTMEKSNFRTSAVLILLLFVSFIAATGAQVQKTYNWKYPVNRETVIKLDNYNCEVVVHSWEKSEAEFHLIIEATGKGPDDEQRLLKYLDNLTFAHSSSVVAFSSSIWKNQNTMNGKTTIEIEGSKDIVLTEFSLKGELWIPAGNRFELGSKYSRIDMEDFNGSLKLELYNDQLFGGNITAPAEISAKYSNMEFKEVKGITAEFYNSNFDAGNCGDIKTDSKYSKINTLSAGNVHAVSYNDKYTFGNTGDVDFSAKYSDLKTSGSGKVTLDCYNGTIEINSAKDVTLTSKYAEFRIGSAGSISIGDTYNDKFTLGRITSLSVGTAKYSNYKIEEIGVSLVAPDCYNDDFEIARTTSGLKEMKISGSYLSVDAGIPSSLNIRLKADIKYPSFEIKEGTFTAKTKISDDTSVKYEGIRGQEKADMPLIDLSGNNFKFRISDVR